MQILARKIKDKKSLKNRIWEGLGLHFRSSGASLAHSWRALGHFRASKLNFFKALVKDRLQNAIWIEFGSIWGGFGGNLIHPKGSWLGWKPNKQTKATPLSTNPTKPRRGPVPPQSHVFRDPFFEHERSPAQPESSRIQIWNPGLQKWVMESKIPKLCTEKPCRIQWSVFQTEPYVRSYGLKPFLAHPP